MVWLGAVASVSWISHLCECGFRRLFCLLSCCFASGSLGFVDTADPRLSCCSVRRSGPALGQPVFGTDKQDGSFPAPFSHLVGFGLWLWEKSKAFTRWYGPEYRPGF